MYDIDHMPALIEIGHTGETNFKTIQINMASWMEVMPNGVPSIVHIRPGEAAEDAYIASTTFANNILSWTIQSSDLGEHEGAGLAQVWLEENPNSSLNKLGMSTVFATLVKQSVSDGSTEIPDPQLPWLQQMNSIKTETVIASSGAEDAKALAIAAKVDAETAAALAIIGSGLVKFEIDSDGHLILSYTGDVPIVIGG